MRILNSVAPGKQHVPARQGQPLPGLSKPAMYRINLSYQTGWERPIVHHSICGNEWTRRTMEEVRSDQPPTQRTSRNQGDPMPAPR
jgi:hypothetical protein